MAYYYLFLIYELPLRSWYSTINKKYNIHFPLYSVILSPRRMQNQRDNFNFSFLPSLKLKMIFSLLSLVSNNNLMPSHDTTLLQNLFSSLDCHCKKSQINFLGKSVILNFQLLYMFQSFWNPEVDMKNW